MTKCFLHILLILGTFLTARAQDDAASQEKKIRELRQRSNLAIENHQVAGILNVLTDDVNVTASNRQVFSGKEEFKKAWTSLFAENSELYFVREPGEVSVSLDGNTAWEQGNWEALGPKTTDWKSYGGKYSALWVKIAVGWKIKSQLFVKLY
ncbi:MAG: DUF4440 domain-containing protein [Cyclobacteriaceae bacterium]